MEMLKCCGVKCCGNVEVLWKCCGMCCGVFAAKKCCGSAVEMLKCCGVLLLRSAVECSWLEVL